MVTSGWEVVEHRSFLQLRFTHFKIQFRSVAGSIYCLISIDEIVKLEIVVGTAGLPSLVEFTCDFFGAQFASNRAEPATDGYLRATTEAVARYSPLLCQISQEQSKQHLLELRPESGLVSSASR